MKPKKWTTKSLGEISKFKSGGTPSKSNPNFWGGDIPWVTAKDMKTPLINNSIDKLTPEALKVAKLAPCETLLILVRGMTLHKDLPLAITTRELAFNQDIKALTTCKEVLPMFLMVYLSSQKHKILQLVDSAGHGTGRLDTELLKSFPINYPTIFEQKQIVGVLATWENAIEKTEALIAAKEKQFEWLCTNLLSGRKKSFGFTGKSIPTAFGSIFSLFKKVNTSCADYEVLSVTKDGIVSQSEYFNKEVASKDKSKYLIVDKDTLVMSGLNFWMGAIDFQTIRDTGIVSPAYKTFKVNEGPYNRDYLRFFIRSHYMTKILLDSSIQGASIVRRNLDMEWLSNSLIDLPNLEEQIDIANILSLAEKEIDGLKLLAKKYRSQKRGLMQKLLTGVWQVGSSQHLSEETYPEASA